MTPRAIKLAVCLGLGVSMMSVGWFVGRHIIPTMNRTRDQKLVVRRIRPNNGDATISISPLTPTVEFVYELKNSGVDVVDQPAAHLFCQCAVTEPLPATIAPGETVRFGFRFPPPQAGHREEKVRITAANRPGPIAELVASVYANVPVHNGTVACVSGDWFVSC